jgi:signal peptidase I
VIFAVFLWIQGIILGLLLIGWFTIFLGSHLFTPLIISYLLLLACSCVIDFYLAFHFRHQSWVRSVISFVLIWGLPLLGIVLLNTATARVRIEGHSMDTSISDGGYYIVDRQAYKQRAPQRGDIIIYYLSDNPDSFYVSRVIGLPEEQVDISEGAVYINNIPLLENYISTPALYTGHWKINNGQYFVLGDNRSDSYDSHSWGGLPKKNIIGKVVGAYWPSEIYGDSFLFQPIQ